MKALSASEKELVGAWICQDGKTFGDATCERIKWLVEHSLELVAHSKAYGAWETLYRDPSDSRYWELIYPKGHMHGGGPSTLRWISKETAQEKYDIKA